jgi:hypothetical protein
LEKSTLSFPDTLGAVKKNTQFYRIMSVTAMAGTETLPKRKEGEQGRILSGF